MGYLSHTTSRLRFESRPVRDVVGSPPGVGWLESSPGGAGIE